MEFTEYFYLLVKQIPKGKVSTYGALAKALGDIRASRAVGRMLNENPYWPVVPCHRVVMSDGSIGGFGTGVNRKIKLLEKEGVIVEEGNILDFDDVLFTEFKSEFPLIRMRKEQKSLKGKISLKDGFSEIGTVAGVDVAYSDYGFGACVVYDYYNMELVEKKVLKKRIEFPYIPTYLGFRELPVIADLLNELETAPSVLLVDGNGILHPYGMGIASHVGVKLDIPTIGCAKSLLCGNMTRDIRKYKEHSNIEFEGKKIGYAFLSSPRARKPIYISPGHKVSFETSFDVVRKLSRYKIPRPLRDAHILATQTKDNFKK